MNLVNNSAQKGDIIDVPVVCATVRQRVCDVLIEKTMSAAEKYGYKTVAVARRSIGKQRIKASYGKRMRKARYKALLS